MKDLRTHWARCAHTLEVEKTVNCAHEIPAVLAALEARGTHDAVLFHNVVNNNGRAGAYRVVVNLFARQDSIADALAEAGADDIDAFNALVAEDGEWQVVDQAPVKETVLSGDAIDLNDIPIVTHHERDAGPYITSGVVVVKDPDTGTYNAAIQRLLVHDPRTLGIFMVPTGQNKIIQRKYGRAGKDMPIAVIIGHHPLFYFAAQTKEPIERDEYRIAASLMRDGFRLTPCPTFPDLLVPADAELVIEGVLPATERQMEGPFGEYTHYYCAAEKRELIRVTSIMHRRDPLFLDIFACHRDHHLLEGTLMTAQLTQILRARYPEFRRLSLPVSGCCQFYCYVSVKQRPGLDLNAIGLELLAAQEYIKYVVFVDEDVDIDDEAAVLWAIATRATLSADMTLTRAVRGTQMDPTVKGREGPERGVIDATAKDPAMLVNRVRVKPDVLANLNVDDYVPAQYTRSR